ncbi:MAG: PEP-CTERM sorting domain-containing protein [Desulfobacterales bacterium]|nr:PEP-CTERM sorting domain-containing protein [Desulfobacterales bacterium]
MKKLFICLTLVLSLVAFNGAASAATFTDDFTTDSGLWYFWDADNPDYEGDDAYLTTGSMDITDGVLNLNPDKKSNWMYVQAYAADYEYMFLAGDTTISFDVKNTSTSGSGDGWGLGLEFEDGSAFDIEIDSYTLDNELGFVPAQNGDKYFADSFADSNLYLMPDIWYTTTATWTASSLSVAIAYTEDGEDAFGNPVAAGDIFYVKTVNDGDMPEPFFTWDFDATKDLYAAAYIWGDGGSPITFDNFVVEGTMAEVPVPGAVWLFGSGLLGMVGLRRRNRK